MAYHEMKTMTKKTWDPGLLSRSDKNGTASSPKNPATGCSTVKYRLLLKEATLVNIPA